MVERGSRYRLADSEDCGSFPHEAVTGGYDSRNPSGCDPKYFLEI